ncbi:hypothetical protein D3C81_654220 [compost metagenome]
MSRLGTPPKGTFGLSQLGHVIGAAAQPIAGKPAHTGTALILGYALYLRQWGQVTG